MSFETVTMYRLACDGCRFAREPVEKYACENATAVAIDFCGWNEMEGGIYCGECSWRCLCGKTFRGTVPSAGMCEECERNQYGRLIGMSKDWEPCPGSGRTLFLHEGPSPARHGATADADVLPFD